MKKFFLVFAATFLSLCMQAGGLLHNTNQSIAFQRMMARGASHEIDAVYTNPAGISFMEHNGWTLSLNIQSAYQKRNVDATILTPAGMGLFPDDTYHKKYEGTAAAPIIPSVYAAYKTPKWAISGFFGIVGGGGKATFDDGLPMFDAAVMAGIYSKTKSLAPILGSPITPSMYNLDSYMKGKQYIFGGQLGFSYKFTNNLSGYAGFRVNYFTGSYVGHVNATAGEKLATTLQGASMLMPEYASSLMPLVENGLMQIKLDCTQTGWGVTPILGVNFKTGPLTLAAKYEFKTNLNIENDTKELVATSAGHTSEEMENALKASYGPGVNTPNDLPSVLYVAAGYEIIPQKLRATVEYHFYDDKHAEMANDKQKALKHGTHEVLAGVEWDINKTFTISGGFQNTDYGLSDDYQSHTSFSCDSYSIGLGGAINLSENVKLNVGYFWTTYKDYTKEVPAGTPGYSNTGLQGKDVYSRTNKVFGVGVDYKF